jgi:4-amino-4-deoxy-L-arabinose transferase-like glycosyltransferase
MTIVAQILLVSGISVVVAYIGKRFVTAEIGILAATICAIDPWLSYAALTVLNEALFSIFFVSSFLIGAIALQKQNWQLALLWGIFLGLATLVRPVTQHHFVIPILLFALLPIAATHKLRLAGIALIGFGLLVGGWIIRNQMETGNSVLVTHRGTTLLWKTTHLTRESTAEDYAEDAQLAAARDVIVRMDELRAELAAENPDEELPTDGYIAFIALRRELGLSEYDADILLGDIAIENVFQNPFYFVVQAPQNVFIFLTSVSRPISFGIDLGLIKAGVSEGISAGSYLYPALNLALRIGTIISFGPLLLYGLYRSWLQFPQARWLTLAFCLSLSYHFLVVVLVVADDRYRIPLHGLMWLYVSIGFVYLPWARLVEVLQRLGNWKYSATDSSRFVKE